MRDPTHQAAQTVLARGFHFEEVAAADPESLAEQVVQWAAALEESVYAVPGNAVEAPETLPLLRIAAAGGVEVEIVPAVREVDLALSSDALALAHAAGEAARAGSAFARLVSLMARLRAPGGCPWDREQTHSSLANHLLEEAYETLDAIDRGDMVHLEEELGDLLLQIVFHSEIAHEEGHFEAADVAEELIAKLVQRHPHVFGDAVVESARDVVVRWEALKHEQKGRASLTEEIPKNLPALLYAHKVQRRIAGATAEFRSSADAIVELAKAAEEGGDQEAVVGDLLYEVVALAMRAGVDPEGALRKRAAARLRGREGGAG